MHYKHKKLPLIARIEKEGSDKFIIYNNTDSGLYGKESITGISRTKEDILQNYKKIDTVSYFQYLNI